MKLHKKLICANPCNLWAILLLLSFPLSAQEAVQRFPYFGDLHVHTSWSLDAYIIFNRTTPEDAYRFARGEEIEFYGGEPRQLAMPLDFVAVTEHAEFLGETLLCSQPSTAAYRTSVCADMRNEQQDPAIENRVFRNLLLKILTSEKPQRPAFCGTEGQDCRRAAHSRWQDIRRIADEYYQPGKFTTFIGYEWTGERNGNRHRNVIFRNNTVPETPWSMIEVPTVEELWEKLDQDCLAPCEVLTISHNSNQSRGVRFAGVNTDGAPFTREDARYRAAHEPLVEIMQFKGESECRVGLGTEDEFCNFEKYDLRPLCSSHSQQGSAVPCVPVCTAPDQPPGCATRFNYVRNGLQAGLEFQQRLGANPYKLGLLGSTDAHNANPGDTGENAYRGHFGYLDAAAEDRLVPALKTGFKQLPRNPGALAGVWAEENTRDSIFAAFQRRETFGTSGNRILIRFFGGWDFPARLEPGTDLAELGYRHGVPMGADLPTRAATIQDTHRFGATIQDTHRFGEAIWDTHRFGTQQQSKTPIDSAHRQIQDTHKLVATEIREIRDTQEIRQEIWDTHRFSAQQSRGKIRDTHRFGEFSRMNQEGARADVVPRFLVWAMQAVDGEKLQRLQVIKGWLEDGVTRERVYDVACSDNLVPDPDTRRCPDNGARVNLEDCSVTPDRGATQLQGVWEDPDFDAGEHAFYYLRVLENPRCRWSTFDALRLGRAPPPETAPTIQERAWSSPIWYSASRGQPTGINEQQRRTGAEG